LFFELQDRRGFVVICLTALVIIVGFVAIVVTGR
jgi:hypothetical protein